MPCSTTPSVAAILLLSLGLSLRLFAQDAPAVQGEVKKIDLATGRITIKHGPIPRLGMTADETTDDFSVGDPIMLNAVTVGNRLMFVADRVNGRLVIKAILPPHD